MHGFDKEQAKIMTADFIKLSQQDQDAFNDNRRKR